MTGNESDLARIAAALERLAPAPPPEADPAHTPVMGWNGSRLVALPPAATLPAARFHGVDSQIAALRRNFAALAGRGAAHDSLLWGARGMGKSALTRALAMEAGLSLVETGADGLSGAPALFARLAPCSRAFILFVDDLAFDAGDGAARVLRSLLDGGVAARPANVRLVVTSNHRHLLRRAPAHGEQEVRHARDHMDDELALVDRFGLVLGFHPPDQDTYLAMVRGHLAAEGLTPDPEDAIAFALSRGGRSGRTAWHYRTEVLTRQKR